MKLLCVDHDSKILEDYRKGMEELSVVESIEVFEEEEKALEWAREHAVDVAFLDIEPEKLDGIALAQALRQLYKSIRIIFSTAYEEYALAAFREDAIGYLCKPFTKGQLIHELGKALLVRDIPQKFVQIETIPSFVMYVDQEPVHFERSKAEEMMALLVDRAGAGITPGEAIACLWPDRDADESTMTLFRVTFHRLMEELKRYGIDFIIGTEGRKRFIRRELVDCDVYHILRGNTRMLANYSDEYMREYSWAESRNAQLSSMKDSYW